MATKLARQIAAFLVAHDRIAPYQADGTPDLIDRVLKDRTIKRSRINEMDAEASFWCKWVLKLSTHKQDLREKLWAAEQEVHDLKAELEQRDINHERVERAQDSNIEALNKRLEFKEQEAHTLACWLAGAANIITNLQHDKIVLMAGQVVHFADELIEPPLCLNPADALKWTSSKVANSESPKPFLSAMRSHV